MTEDRSARRILIADAALEVLSARGARGLTHHAVDDEAGLSRGSTSYYCRRRADLVGLVLDRVVELDLGDVERCGREIAATSGSADEVAATLAGLVVAWLTPPARRRTAARLELFLLAGREPDLASRLAAHRAAFLRVGLQIHDAAGTQIPSERLPWLFMAVDGVLLTHIRLDLEVPPRDDVAKMLVRLLVS